LDNVPADLFIIIETPKKHKHPEEEALRDARFLQKRSFYFCLPRKLSNGILNERKISRLFIKAVMGSLSFNLPAQLVHEHNRKTVGPMTIIILDIARSPLQ
jgi:hypothetical protein